MKSMMKPFIQDAQDDLSKHLEAALSVDIQALLDGKTTLAQIQGLTESDLEKIYQVAYQLFQEHQDVESAAHFVFLVLHFPYDARFHFGLASCLKRQEKYTEAAQFFANALLLDCCDAKSCYFIAECLIAQDLLEDAREALQTTIQLSYAKESYFPIRVQAEKLLTILDRE